MMAQRHSIGLLLATEEDWPSAFESVLRRPGAIRHAGLTPTFSCDRLLNEPFDLEYVQHSSLVQRSYLVRIGEQVTARERQRVHDQALEDVGGLVGNDVLQDPDTLSGPVINRSAFLKSQVGDRQAQLSGARTRLLFLFPPPPPPPPFLFLLFSFNARTYAAGHGAGMMRAPSRGVGTHARTSFRTGLFISPTIVTVGQRVTLSVVAPIPSVVRISFRSFHHAFVGAAIYQPSSRSYVESVYLIPRVHGTERAQVVASVKPRATGRAYQLFGQFFIRGQSMGMSGTPQNNGGDGDADNNGAPSDGDGNR